MWRRMWTVGPKVSAIRGAIIHKVSDFGAFDFGFITSARVGTIEINA